MTTTQNNTPRHHVTFSFECVPMRTEHFHTNAEAESFAAIMRQMDATCCDVWFF